MRSYSDSSLTQIVSFPHPLQVESKAIHTSCCSLAHHTKVDRVSQATVNCLEYHLRDLKEETQVLLVAHERREVEDEARGLEGCMMKQGMAGVGEQEAEAMEATTESSQMVESDQVAESSKTGAAPKDAEEGKETPQAAAARAAAESKAIASAAWSEVATRAREGPGAWVQVKKRPEGISVTLRVYDNFWHGTLLGSSKIIIRPGSNAPISRFEKLKVANLSKTYIAHQDKLQPTPTVLPWDLLSQNLEGDAIVIKVYKNMAPFWMLTFRSFMVMLPLLVAIVVMFGLELLRQKYVGKLGPKGMAGITAAAFFVAAPLARMTWLAFDTPWLSIEKKSKLLTRSLATAYRRLLPETISHGPDRLC